MLKTEDGTEGGEGRDGDREKEV